MSNPSAIAALPSASQQVCMMLAWSWLLAIIFSASVAHAAAPQLQVESSTISGGEQLAIAADGRLIAEEQEGIVTLRDGMTGRSLRSWRVPKDFTGTRQLCFPDDHKILAIVDGSHVDLWDTASGTLLDWDAETEWSDIQNKHCLNGVGVLAQNAWEAKAGQLNISGLRLPNNPNPLPQLRVKELGEHYRLIAVPGGKFVAVGQYHFQRDDRLQPHSSLSLVELGSGQLRWQVPDIPSTIQFGEVITLAVIPDGRYLAYVQQARSHGDTIATRLTQGPVVVVEPRTGKRLKLAGLRGLQAQRVAFVNHGAWLMIAAENPDSIAFFDLRSGQPVRTLKGRFKALFNGSAQSMIVQKENAAESSIIDLPSFVERARIGRATATLQTLSVIQDRLLIAGGSHVKEVPVLAPSQGLDLEIPSKDFLYDTSTGRIAYGLGVNDSIGAVKGFIRRSSGQTTAFRLPQGDIIWDSAAAAFAPGGKLLVTGQIKADVDKFQTLFEQDLNQIGTGSADSASQFASRMPTRFYWVDNDGHVSLAGEKLGVPSKMRISPDGQQLWLAKDHDLVVLHLPSLVEQNRIDIGNDIADFHFLPDGRSVMVQSANSISIWRGGKLLAAYPTEFSSASLAGPYGGLFVAEKEKLKRWFPEHSVPNILPVPSKALVSENLSHYVSNGQHGSEWIDVASGQKKLLGNLCDTPVRISADGRYLICQRASPENTPHLYALVDAVAGREIRAFQHAGDQAELGFSADSTRVFYIQRVYVQQEHHALFTYMAMEIASGAQRPIFSSEEHFFGRGIKTSDDGSVLGVALSGQAGKADGGSVKIFKEVQGHYTLLASIQNPSTQNIQSLDVSPQGDWIAFGNNHFLSVHHAANGARLQHIKTRDSYKVRFDPTGKFVAGLPLTGQDISVYDIASGRLVRDMHIPFKDRQVDRQLASFDFIPANKLTLTRHGIVEPYFKGALRHPLAEDETNQQHEILFVDDVAIHSMAQLSPTLLALLRDDGLITLFNTQSRKVLARIAMMPSGNWVVIAPDGRFDTSSLEDLAALHWVLPDDPYRPLPLELFMRQYYEPGLMQKLVHDAPLSPLPDLTALNRAQPKVIIDKVRAGADPQRVDVTVKFEEGEYAGVRNGQAVTERSGLRHVRLFRNGQLVGTLRDDSAKDAAIPHHWTFKNIRLPAGKAGRAVAFTAYAFNSDGVKGSTHAYQYLAPRALQAKTRAVIVSIGVNQYENSRFDLIYAGHDARTFGQAVAQRIKRSGRYSEVVSHTLISDLATPQAAIKQNIRGLFERLAGKGGNKALPTLTPNDTLIVFFAGHGELDETGEFYLLPHDIGPRVDNNIFKRSISSAELAAWLRDVDAREIVLVVDACHSAGAVGGKEFKPGPMGSRGLGQLVYDKGMRILAATQADDLALEVGKLRHGLLTYALVRNGLEQAQADFRPKDGAVLLNEWLQYATDGVPRLAQQAIDEEQTGRGALFKTRGSEASLKALQQPALFDFRRSRAQELRLQ